MKTKSNPLRLISTAFALIALASGTASAAVIATALVGLNNVFSVSTTDIADASQGGTVSFTGTENFGSSAAKVINGDVYESLGFNQTGPTLTPSVGNILTLNLAPSVHGWDISSIMVLTGVAGTQSQRSDHSYTIAFSTDGVNFGSPIINVNNSTALASATTGGEVQMTIADNASVPLGTKVTNVRFVFGNAIGFTENMYREIDVLGVASIPEPSSLLLLGLAGAGLLVRRRR